MSHPAVTRQHTSPAPRPTDSKATGAQPSGPNVPLPPQPADSGPALCGQAHTYKTAKGESVSKPCLKARGHSGAHSSRNMQPAIDLSVLSSVSLDAQTVPAEELLEQVQERTRSTEQQRVDSDVANGHKLWIDAGQPTGINDAIKAGAAQRYVVAPEAAAAIRTLLRRAESVNPGIHVKVPPVKKLRDGNVAVYFICVNKAARKTSEATSK